MTTSHYEELGVKVAVRKNVYKIEQKGGGVTCFQSYADNALIILIIILIILCQGLLPFLFLGEWLLATHLWKIIIELVEGAV